MKTMHAFAALALLLAATAGWAQEGNSSMTLTGPTRSGSFTCYANSCMNDTDSWKQSRMRNLREIAEQDCNRRSVNYTERRCQKASEEYAGAKDCYENVCSRATCRSRNLTTGQCVSPAYFR